MFLVQKPPPAITTEDRNEIDQFLGDIEEVDKYIDVKRVQVKNVLCPSSIPYVDFAINPYLGCSHACVYCYAKFMSRFPAGSDKSTDLTKLKWGSFVHIKENSVATLYDKSVKGCCITMSSVTDSWQPLEKKVKLTRKILKKLVEKQPDLKIITKSKLILRDLDLLKQFKNVKVNITMAFSDENTRKLAEPFSSTYEERLRTLRILSRNGISTGAFVCPIFPYLSNWQRVVDDCKDYVDTFSFDTLNLYGYVKNECYTFLREAKREDLIPKYELLYNHPEQDKHKREYLKKLEEDINRYCKERKVKDWVCFFSFREYRPKEERKKGGKEKKKKKRKREVTKKKINDYFRPKKKQKL